MPVNTKFPPLTVENYRLLPETGPRYQLIQGDLYMAPAPNRFHQEISRNLQFELHSYLKRNPIGKLFNAPFDVYLDEFNVFQPDIVIVLNERLEILTEEGAEGAPELVVEILSPKTRRLDLVNKKQEYARAGVKELWIIDPEPRTFKIHQFASTGIEGIRQVVEGDTLSSDLLPGFDLGVAAILEMRGMVNADTPIRPHADTPHRAVFLDRDGVINRPLIRGGKPYPPATLDEFEILPGVPGACELLKKLGFLLVVATNQPDVGRGTLAREAVENMHAWLSHQLPIDRVMTCCHAGAAYGDPCECRKPRPGMLLEAAEALKIDLAKSFMIGDRWRDVDCGFDAGCITVFIDWAYEEKLRRQPDLRALDLLDAAQIIYRQELESHART